MTRRIDFRRFHNLCIGMCCFVRIQIAGSLGEHQSGAGVEPLGSRYPAMTRKDRSPSSMN